MSDLEICASIASNLEQSSWSSILSQLDKDTFDKLQSALHSHKDISETPDETISTDPSAAIKQLNAKLTKLIKGLKAHRGRFERMEEQNKALNARISQMEHTSPQTHITAQTTAPIYDSSISKPSQTNAYTVAKPRRRSRKLKSMPKSLDDVKENDTDTKHRMHFYQFGSRRLQVLKPSEYPTKKEAQRPVEGKLELFYSHGYSGNFEGSRQNICLSHDGTKLIYYIAAIAVVYDYNKNEQQFFTKHNDDVTTLCVSPSTTWAATGQKDPKDEPGQGPDLPKIWIWDYVTMKPIQLIDNVCWGEIRRLRWSKASNLLYCIGGDENQSLKAYDPEHFTGKKEPQSLVNINTTRETILGFVINDAPNHPYYDEFILFGKRKFCHCGVTMQDDTGKLSVKIKQVSTVAFRKDGEKSFGCAQWLPDGRYLVGAQSGNIYVARERQCLCVIKAAHAKSVGCLVLTMDQSYIISAGHDRMLKRWKLKKPKPSIENDDDEKLTNAEEDTGDSEKKKELKSTKKAKRKKESTKTTTSPSRMRTKVVKNRTQSSPLRKRKDVKDKAKKTPKKTPKKKKKVASPLLKLWEHELKMQDTDYHLQPRSMVYNDDTGELFVGSKTNQIMKFEMENESASVIVDGHDGAIWGLCTHPELPLFATGGYDNAVKIWDATTMTCIKTYEFELEQGDKKGHEISCGHWSNNGNVIAFGTENTSCIAVFSWDSNTMDLQFQHIYPIPPKSKNAEVEPVAYLRFSEDSCLLAAAHMDSNMYIYSVVSSPGSVLLQKWPMPLPHVAAPTNVQFSEDGTLVKALTRDYEVCHWRLDTSGRTAMFVPNVSDPDVVQWADDPLIAGWNVEGLYQKGWDGTDLNDATLTSDSRLVATGDDYGKVRLHNFPSTDPKTCNVYGGHAEFVVGVEFLRDDSQLITCGGADMAIFQWKVHKNYKDIDWHYA
eukprot:584134_1